MGGSESRRPSLAAVALPALAGGVLVALLAVYFQRGLIPGDSFTYLAAGERLNAGHDLYALVAGDRPVGLKPPYWTVPLLSPPLIAVIFRPLALIGDAGAYVWWVAGVVALGVVIGALVRRRPVAASLAVLVLAIPLTYEIGVGNVNTFLVCGAVATWILARKMQTAQAGVVAAVMVALKLTPLPLAGWIVGVDIRRGSIGIIAGLAAAGLVGVLGAGVQAHVEYLSVVRATGTAGLTTFSAGGLAAALGLPAPIPALVPAALLALGTLLSAVIAAGSFGARRPAVGFAVAVVAWTVGSPVVNINTPVVLLALLAPIAWPWPAAGPSAVTSRTPALRSVG